jgi:hypothetical protein
MLTFSPLNRRVKPAWMFRFSYPYALDEEFEIFTNVFGEIEVIFPRKDIESYLRKLEKRKIHPYSNEAREQNRQQRIRKKQIAHEKGISLFEASSFKKDFEDHFTLSNIEAPENTSTDGVYFFPKPEWWATLSPKKNYTMPCKVSAIFPIKDNSTIEASITPKEIEDALDRCLSHPYVLNYIASNAITGIRLRITGDRLHWDTPKLQEFLVELKGVEAREEQLRNWSRIIIDAEGHRLLPIYLNSISGELIYTDTTANCSKPILVPCDPIRVKQTNVFD